VATGAKGMENSIATLSAVYLHGVNNVRNALVPLARAKVPGMI
jgi:hypothetical protein